MSKIRIATDSTADIPKSFFEELGIAVLPLTIISGEKAYPDRICQRVGARKTGDEKEPMVRESVHPIYLRKC